MKPSAVQCSVSPSQSSATGAGIRRTFKDMATPLAALAMIAISLLVQSCSSDAQAGPNGGDVIPMGDGQTSAEVMSNADSGEVMVHTWGKDLKTAHPIEAKALTMGSGTNQIQLEPHPLPGDPAGKCSRFYGRAEWLRGGECPERLAEPLQFRNWQDALRLEPRLAGGGIPQWHVDWDGGPRCRDGPRGQRSRKSWGNAAMRAFA